MNEIKTVWQFPLLEVTENKRSGRSGVARGEAYELVGVDGSVDGGLAPFPGFRALETLDPTLEADNDIPFNGSLTPPEHDWIGGPPSSPVYYVDSFRAVTFRVGTDSYGYGFVYRVRNGFDISLADPDGRDHYFIHYYIDQGTVPNVREITNFLDHDTLGGDWNVRVLGRLVYLLVEGQLPVLFYVDRDDDEQLQEHGVGGVGTGTTTGPGAQPILYPHDHSQSIGSFTATPTAPGTGQIVLTTYPPSALPVDWPGAIPQADSEARQLEPGDYAFAYQLVDSQTGRKSKLSQIAPIQTVNFDPAAAGGGSSGGSASTDQEDISKYAIIELAYDKAKYDKMYLYRSVMTQKAGGTFVASILQLERIVDLKTYAVGPDPGGTTGHALYYFTLEDKALVWQETYRDERSDFDDEMPRAGEGIVHENTLFLSKIKEATSPLVNRGLGELRWSSLADIGVELFPVVSKYIPTTASNQIIAFATVGPNVVGFSKDRQYLIRKEGLYVKVLEMHEGFGAVNPKSVTSVGNMAYFLSEKGLKAVATDGQLDDVRALNHYFLQEWRERLHDTQVVFDPAAGVMVVHQPSTEPELEEDDPDTDLRIYGDPGRLALLWFNTARVTEVYDTPFWDACEGDWPVGTNGQAPVGTDRKSELVRRAFFLQSYKTGEDGVFRVYAIDYTRAKVVSGAGSHNGERRTTLLDTTGDSRFSVGVVASSPGTQLGSFSVAGGIIGSGWQEARMYVLSSPSSPTNVGRSAKVLNAIAGTFVVDNVTIFNNGDRVGLSPVHMRATAWQIGLQDPEGREFMGKDFFRVRHADAMGVAFDDVEGPNTGANDARAFLGLFKGNSPEPEFRVAGRTTSGSDVSTVTEGEPVYYAQMGSEYGFDASNMYPFVEIFCPDLEYRALALLVTGMIRSSSRTSRPV